MYWENFYWTGFYIELFITLSSMFVCISKSLIASNNFKHLGLSLHPFTNRTYPYRKRSLLRQIFSFCIHLIFCFIYAIFSWLAVCLTLVIYMETFLATPEKIKIFRFHMFNNLLSQHEAVVISLKLEGINLPTKDEIYERIENINKVFQNVDKST